MPSFIVHLIVDRTNRFIPVRTRTISSIKIEQSNNRFFEIRKSRDLKKKNSLSKMKKVKKSFGRLAMDIHLLKRIVHAGHRIAGFLGLQLTPNNLRSNVLFPEFHFLQICSKILVFSKIGKTSIRSHAKSDALIGRDYLWSPATNQIAAYQKNR